MKRIFFFLCLLGIVACKKEGAKTIDPGYDYYPAGLFSEWEYAVDSIVLNDFTISTDTYKFYIKERLEERMQNGNSISVRVQQYRRASDSESWSAGKSKAFVLSDRHVEELDNNLRTYSLIFPVKEGESWNANAPNTLGTEINTYARISSEVIGGYSYVSVALVDRRNEQDALKINTDIALDKYGKGVGLVYRYRENIKRFTTGQLGETPIDSGLIYAMTLQSYRLK